MLHMVENNNKSTFIVHLPYFERSLNAYKSICTDIAKIKIKNEQSIYIHRSNHNTIKYTKTQQH